MRIWNKSSWDYGKDAKQNVCELYVSNVEKFLQHKDCLKILAQSQFLMAPPKLDVVSYYLVNSDFFRFMIRKRKYLQEREHRE